MTDSELIKTIVSKLEMAQKNKIYGSISVTICGGKIVTIETKKTEKIGAGL